MKNLSKKISALVLSAVFATMQFSYASTGTFSCLQDFIVYLYKIKNRITDVIRFFMVALIVYGADGSLSKGFELFFCISKQRIYREKTGMCVDNKIYLRTY